MKDFKLLYFGFINATHPQILRKIQQQYLAARKLHPNTACLVVGIGDENFDPSGYEFEFVDVRDFGPAHAVPKGELAAQLIERLQPDVVYMRYPIADQHVLELTRRVDNIVFEHQSKELPELSHSGSPLLAQERTFGTRCIERAMGIVGATRDIVDWELARIGKKLPWHVLPNGIDPESLPLTGRNFGERIELLALADFRIWHGLDRFIAGMAQYGGARELHVNVIGRGPELERYAALIAKLGLEQDFTFHGYMEKDQITAISERCQVVIGALAHHRIELTELCSLKNREYCLRGMPFVFACSDPDFPPDLEFVVNVPGDETPVDVNAVVALAERNESDPQFSRRVREYALNNLSWETKSPGLLRFFEGLARVRHDAAIARASSGDAMPASVATVSTIAAPTAATAVSTTTARCISKGEDLFSQGKTTEARAAFEAGLALEPDNPVLLNDLGVLAHATGDLARAETLLSRAVQAAPDYADPAHNLRAVRAARAAQPKRPHKNAASSPAAKPSSEKPLFEPFDIGRTERPLNILFVQNAPCIRNYKMATALRARGHKITLAYTLKKLSERYKGLSDGTYDDNIPLTSYRQLWDMSRGYDLVHCHNEPDDLTVAALAGPTPVIHDTHDLISLRAGGDANLAYLEGIANRGAAGRIYTTPFQLREAQQMYGVDGPSMVFFNYASEADLPGKWLPKLSDEDGRTHVVYEGGVGGNAHRDFRDVFVEMGARGLVMHIYPAAYRDDLAAFFSRAKNVNYYEPVSPKVLIREMSRYDFGVIPWNVEKGNKRFLDSTIANKLFEYMAAGLPVAASKLESYASYFSEHPTGVTFKNVDELMRLVPRLKEMAATIDYSKELYTFEREITRIEDFYYSVLDRRCAVPNHRNAGIVTDENQAAPEPASWGNGSANEQVGPLAASACEKLTGWLDANGWDGWDPYDVKDFFLRQEQVGNVLNENVRRDIEAMEKQDPVGVRNQLRIQPKRIPKGLGLLAAARVRLYKATTDETHLEEAIRLADWLLKNPSQGYDNLCWGYPFDWQSQIFIPRDTPSIVVTCVVGDGLWELWTVTRDQRYLDACTSICRFITHDLNIDIMGSRGVCFSYTPIDNFHVHNANLFGAEFLARVGRETKTPAWLELASRAADYALAEQNADGSIFYWGRKQDYVPGHLDHYHSGFEIRCLYRLWHHLGREDVRDGYLRYLNFYKKTYVGDDGTPMARPGAPYPVNIHGAAEGILLCATLAPEHPELMEPGRRMLTWTVRHMQHDEGWFGHLWSPDHRPGPAQDIAHLRWGQGWMLRALGEFVHAQAAEDSRARGADRNPLIAPPTAAPDKTTNASVQ